jgi:Xaa-Pro aminopeptidase
VLKGHIGVASAVFPVGTTGSALDSMARRPLWEAGLDYNHRTGHGVGSYLSVHEGPGYIGAKEQVPLQPGMVISNEPGYYKTGAYGIRIESLVAVEQVKIEGAEREMLGLRTLTLCPIDRNAIDVDLLTAAERDWLNAYHQRVWTELAPALNTEEQLWLKAATAAL